MLANVHPPFPRTFVPQDLKLNDFSDVEPLYRELLDRPIDSPPALETWLLNFSELSCVFAETWSRRYIDKSCHTDDKALEAAYLKFVEEIDPKVKPLYVALQKKFLASPHRSALTDRRYRMIERSWQADVDVFRDENVALETETEKLVNEYDKLSGAMMVDFDGKEQTPQQMARYQELPDRSTREQAWRATTARWMRDRDAVEDIFDQTLALRNQMAANAGLPDYRALTWKRTKRFDYTPADCQRFADSVAATVVPLVREFQRARAQRLGLERLRPWDLSVDPLNRPPLRPFDEADIDGFVANTHAIFQRLSPALANDFDSLRRNENLDLASRKGKQPGGYATELDELRQPFIFMNAAGLHRDVEILLHEAGHAFHALATRDEPLQFVRSAPMEFCEVASMTMELFGGEHLDVFYNAADLARARRMHLEGSVIGSLTWIAAIDSFQHWIYTHSGHTRDQRTEEWLRLVNRFGGDVDYSGFEDVKANRWQRQLHLFHFPFYYIEYGIAQLGALQLWLKSRENPRQALANYRAALTLGGTRPLPELFAAAGITFDFSEKTVWPLVNAVREELASLPE
jgi:oligoendopeptidase F